MEFDLPEKLNIDELFETEENTQNQKKQVYLKVKQTFYFYLLHLEF